MFERYTEKARRTIFFARYEASQYGSPYIETEHLLLGLLREDKPLTARLGRSKASPESIREQIERKSTKRQVGSASIDIPLSNESRRVLAYAAEEAEFLEHPRIGSNHLLLGLLREEDSLAAKVLRRYDIELLALREEFRNSPDLDQPMPPRQPQAHTIGRVIHMQQPLPLPAEGRRILRSIRLGLSVVIAGLILSGVTAFPLVHELHLMVHAAAHLNLAQHAPLLNAWLLRVNAALSDTDTRYPFLAYGTDWLAFAHLVIAAAFIGPWRDPIRNKWLIDWALLACAGVPLLAFIAGPIRGIPLYWRLIDCSFGIVCCVPLFILRRRIQQLERFAPFKL